MPLLLINCSDSQPTLVTTTDGVENTVTPLESSPVDEPADPARTFARVPELYDNAFDELSALYKAEADSLAYKIGSFTASFGGIGSE